MLVALEVFDPVSYFLETIMQYLSHQMIFFRVKMPNKSLRLHHYVYFSL